MNNHDLAKIVKQVQTNKEKYFEKLFNEIYRTIYYLSFKFLDNETEAQDVSQEILLYIYNHIDELNLPEGFNNWMNRIIYNKCKDRKKQLYRRKEDDYKKIIDSKEEQIMEDSPEILLQEKEKNEFILDIVSDLPMKQKEVVLLYYYQQLTAPEIASVLSCSLSSIQNRLHNAKNSIRERVEKSKSNTTQQQLFGVAGVPILFKILIKDVNRIVKVQVKNQLWRDFITIKKIALKQSNKKYRGIKYKTNTVMLCLTSIIVILLIRGTVSTMISLSNSKQLQEQSEGTELQSESIILKKIEENRIPNKNGNLTTENLAIKKETTSKQVEGTNPFVESAKGSWQLIDISKEYQIVKWNKQEAKEFTNTAILEDKDLEDLKYTNPIGDKTTNDTVYEENEYKKDSDIVYIMSVSPILSFEKSSSVENNIITYYINVENTGQVVACNILVKDMLPEHTDFFQILEKQENQNIKISVQYKENWKTIFWNITQLEVGEKVTLAFQVVIEVNAYKKNREIRNIAYLKVAEQQNNLDSQLIEEQGYIKSNEIIHIMQHQKEIEPQTSDGLQESSLFFVLIIFSIIVIYKTVKKSKIGRNRKER